MNSEDIRVIVHEVLDGLINEITELESSHKEQKTAKPFKETDGTSVLVRDSVTNGDLHSVSPTSEDSGIGCSLSHADDTKPEDSELTDYSDQRHDGFNDTTATQESSDSTRVKHTNKGQSSHVKESEPQLSSLFGAFSSNVKYWLGQGSYDKNGKVCLY